MSVAEGGRLPDLPPSREWVMTQEAFDTLLRWLDEDREEAGKAYENIRAGLMKFFECHGCPYYEEYADEVFQRAARKISEGAATRPEKPYSYFLGIARNRLREYWQSRDSKAVALEALSPLHQTAPDVEKLAEQELNRRIVDREVECLEECLQTLPADVRELFTEYYRDRRRARIDNRASLAERLGIAVNALRIRIHRIGTKLERCVRACSERD